MVKRRDVQNHLATLRRVTISVQRAAQKIGAGARPAPLIQQGKLRVAHTHLDHLVAAVFFMLLARRLPASFLIHIRHAEHLLCCYPKRPPAADNPNCRFRLISQRPSAKGERASIDFVRTNCEIRNLSYFVSLRGGGCAVPFEPPPFVHRDGLTHVGHGNDFPRPTWDPNPSVEPGTATPGSPSRKGRRALPTTLQLLQSGHARNPQRQQRAHPAFRVRCSASAP